MAQFCACGMTPGRFPRQEASLRGDLLLQADEV